jgi:hypothetical protein
MRRRAHVLKVAAQAFLVAVAIPVLSRLDLDVLQRVLEPRRSGRASRPEDVRGLGTEYATIVDAVVRRARPVVRRNCLTRGITLYALLRRAGVEVSLCFGIDPQFEGHAAGHCWLVLDDQPFLESSDPRSTFTGVATVSSAGVA